MCLQQSECYNYSLVQRIMYCSLNCNQIFIRFGICIFTKFYQSIFSHILRINSDRKTAENVSPSTDANADK